MTIQEYAQKYIDMGLAVVPIVAGEKRAATKWQSKVYKASDFGPTDGIAIKCGEPSQWLVDVDLDHPYAVEAAKVLLPTTGLVHGRSGKPSSHYWYICEGAKTKQYTDVKASNGTNQMLIELRSSGGYTIVPPSIHPSGEEIGYESERDALRIDLEPLQVAVRHVALCTMIAIHYPAHGARHAFMGHAAGFLLRSGVHPMAVQRILETAARIAGDKDLSDRANFIRTTIAKWTADKDAPITGGPKLAEDLGVDVVNKLRSWLGVADDDAIEQMNAKHFWVRIGRDDVIGREDAAHGEVVFQRPKSLYTEYANIQIKVGEKVNKKSGESVDQFKTLFQAWLESKARRSYREVVFCPPPKTADPRDYNLWKGYGVTPAEGNCDLFLAHLRDVICDGDADCYEYLLNLLALTIQEPGTPSGVAVVLRGEQGTGKGVFVRALGRIFGSHFIQLDNVKHLVGGFNAAISAKVLVFADEAFWAGDKREVGALKRLITEPTLTIERKGIDASSEPNYVHLFMATNEEWAIPAGLHERRFFALKVSSAKIQDTRYFGAIEHQLADGGLAAFLDLMLKRTIDRALLKRVPRTKELRIQQTQSLPSELTWWLDCLFEGRLPGLGWQGSTWIPGATIYTAYLEWTEKHRARALSNVEFGRRMGDYLSATPSKARKISGEVVRCVYLRDLGDARTFFDARMTTITDWPSETVPTQQPLPATPPPF